LFHGGANSVRELAAVLGLRYKQDENGDFDHSNVIFLLDKDGVVRSQQLGLKGDAHDFEQKALELLKTKS
jgi:protein SCO1/2